RVAQQILAAIVPAAAQRDADAGRDHDLVAADVDRRRELAEDPLGYDDGVIRTANVVKQHDEFIAAQPRREIFGEPRDAVGRTYRSDDAARHLDQQLVAGGVSQTVVDDLEVIEIEKQDRNQIVGPPANVPRAALQPVHQD